MFNPIRQITSFAFAVIGSGANIESVMFSLKEINLKKLPLCFLRDARTVVLAVAVRRYSSRFLLNDSLNMQNTPQQLKIISKIFSSCSESVRPDNERTSRTKTFFFIYETFRCEVT